MYENQTHSTDLLNAEALKVVKVGNTTLGAAKVEKKLPGRIHPIVHHTHIHLSNNHLIQETTEPYFLYLAYPAVHDPLAAPERHLKMCDHVNNYRRR